VTSSESGEPVDFDGDEGWYTDPYDRHEARWMSVGEPTALVRDGDTESNDPPPATPPVRTPERIRAEGGGPEDGQDLRRADEAESEAIDAEKLRRQFNDAADEGIGRRG
jgi:hypothetical protein